MKVTLLPRPIHRAGLRIAFWIRHHLRQLRARPIAGVSIILRDGGDLFLLVRHSYGSRDWALPGGGLRPAEDPLDAARRELGEELQVGARDWQKVATFQDVISGAPHTAHLFTARLDGAPRPDGREIVESRFFASDRLPPDLGPAARRRIALWLDWQSGR